MKEADLSKKSLTGLQRICKQYGRVKAGSIMYVWDYANDEAVPESEMKADQARRTASEKALAKIILQTLACDSGQGLQEKPSL